MKLYFIKKACFGLIFISIRVRNGVNILYRAQKYGKLWATFFQRGRVVILFNVLLIFLSFFFLHNKLLFLVLFAFDKYDRQGS